MSTLPFCLPASISPEQFLAEYWQKKPLLIKNGLPQLVGMFEPKDIIELAQDEDATARLISHSNNQWTLKISPFKSKDFKTLPSHWTVLVQNMEQWSPELANLWHAFDFIPQWQRDDIMVSYAPKGGSVGKHYDNYDVFLAQGYGNRRWQLGKYCDETTLFEAGQPIRVMKDMGELIFDEILTPGDVLYVPTGLSHYGEAQDDCLTFSFGCRRPSPLSLLDNLADIATHYDKLLIPLKVKQNLTQAGALDSISLEDIKQQLVDLLQSDIGDKLIQQTILETISKRQYDLLLPEGVIDTTTLIHDLKMGATISQDLASRIVYFTDGNQKQLFINGSLISDDIDVNAQNLLIRLSNGESLNKDAIDKTGVTLEMICDWIENGWVLVNS